MKPLILTLMLTMTLPGFSTETYQAITGDILFMDLDCGSFCEAIKKVTYGIDDTKPTHVGVVYKSLSGNYVFEAGSKGVVLTPINEFLNRSVDAQGNPRIFVGRLKANCQPLITPAIERMVALLGKPYDYAFDINNDNYYCSELIYKAFTDSNGKSIFTLEPMTFNDPDSHAIFPVWDAYFKEHNLPVPEGKPGLNPGGMSRSEKIEIVYRFLGVQHRKQGAIHYLIPNPFEQNRLELTLSAPK